MKGFPGDASVQPRTGSSDVKAFKVEKKLHCGAYLQRPSPRYLVEGKAS